MVVINADFPTWKTGARRNPIHPSPCSQQPARREPTGKKDGKKIVPFQFPKFQFCDNNHVVQYGVITLIGDSLFSKEGKIRSFQ